MNQESKKVILILVDGMRPDGMMGCGHSYAGIFLFPDNDKYRTCVCFCQYYFRTFVRYIIPIVEIKCYE